MRVLLHGHEVRDADGPGARHPSHIVAAQIHQHHVFRALFLVGQKLLPQDAVLFLGGPAATGTGDRPQLHEAILAADQHLRRRAHQFHLGEPQVVHVGRGVDDPEGAVDIERPGPDGCLPPLGQDALKDIAGLDVLLRLHHDLLEIGFAHVGRENGRAPARGAPGRRPAARAEPRDHPVDPPDGIGIGRLMIALADMGVRHNPDRLGHIVEDEQRIREQKAGLGQPQEILSLRGEPLELADHIVAQIPHRAPAEPGQPGDLDRAVLQHDLAETGQQIRLHRDPPPAPPARHDHFPVVAVNQRRRAAPQERVPRPLFTALHAFQKVGARPPIDLGQSRDRGLKVGQHFPGDGNQVSLFGQRAKLFEIRSVSACAHGGTVPQDLPASQRDVIN